MNETGNLFVIGSFVAAITMSVQRLPAPGESVRARSILMEAGGKGFNIAAGARRLGAPVDGLIAVGSDMFAPLAREALERAGLPSTMVQSQPGPSGTGVGLIDAFGENVIAVAPGANSLLSDLDVRTAAARIIASSTILAQYEVEDAPIAAGFAIARKHGVRTILNPSPYRPIDIAILTSTDVIVVNATEARALAHDLRVLPEGEDPISAATSLATALDGAGISALIITLGREGALLWRRGQKIVHQAAFPIDPIDATGCGDAFLAGFAAMLSESSDWIGSLRFAAACGALVCSRMGVFDALPTRSDVIQLLAMAAEP